MATIKFGAIVTDMRGKLGGHVFQKGNQSRVMKTKSKPIKRVSTFTSSNGVFVKNAQLAWRALLSTEKLRWNAITPEFLTQNVFNGVLQLNGFQLYMKLNVQAARAGHPVPLLITNKAIASSAVIITASTVNTSTTTISLTVSGSMGSFRFIALGQIVGNGYSQPLPNQWSRIANFNASLTPNTGLYGAMLSKYGVIRSSDRIYIGIQMVSAFGVAGKIQYVQATVT